VFLFHHQTAIPKLDRQMYLPAVRLVLVALSQVVPIANQIATWHYQTPNHRRVNA
jgi:hypothetical protein